MAFLTMLYSWQFWLAVAIILIIIAWVVGVLILRRNTKVEETDSSVSVVPVKKKRNKRVGESIVAQEQRYARSIKHRNDLDVTEDTAPPKVFCKPVVAIGTNGVDITPQLPTDITSADWKPEERSSIGETECRRVLENIYGVPFKRIRPAWLINHLTGRRMELDGYNEGLKIAFEYNGEQHYNSNHRFNKSQADFVAQVERDNLKVDICDQLGIYLITIPYNVKKEDIERYIRYYLPEAVMARHNRQVQMS